MLCGVHARRLHVTRSKAAAPPPAAAQKYKNSIRSYDPLPVDAVDDGNIGTVWKNLSLLP